jgi:hypothetical protein
MPPAAKKAKNPFYAIVLIVGIGFLLTACAYTVMAFLDAQGHRETTANSGLLRFLNEHGVTVFGVELGVLCVAMVAAFATEDYWQRRFDLRHGLAKSQPRLAADEAESESEPPSPRGSHVG